MENSPFGLPRKKKKFSEYIGRYVIIYPQTGSNSSGKIVEISDDGFARLNPYLGGYFDPKEGFRRKIIYEDSQVNLRNINSIEPSTKENLENVCKFSNQKRSD